MELSTMKRRKFLIGSTAVLTGTGLLAGAKGTSRKESDRETVIEVVGDDDAYLFLEYADANREANCTGEIDIVDLGNQTKVTLDDVSVEYTLTTEDGEFDEFELDVPDSLGAPGSSPETVSATVSCQDSGGATGTVTFDVTVEGNATASRTTLETQRSRAVDIECNCLETGWAEGSGELNSLPGMSTNRWGWYLEFDPTEGTDGTESENAGEGTEGEDPPDREEPIWAGAEYNYVENGVAVGRLQIDRDGEILTVTYDMDDDVWLERADLYVDADTDRLVDINAAPGRLGQHSYEGTFQIDLEEEGLQKEDELVIAAHCTLSI